MNLFSIVQGDRDRKSMGFFLFSAVLVVLLTFSGALKAEDVQKTDPQPDTKKKSGISFQPIPLPSYNNDDGVGMGLRVYATKSDEKLEPYAWQLFAQGYWTSKGREYHVISLDALNFAGTPFRLKTQAGFDRYLNAQWYGTGSYHDIQKQNRIVAGETPVNENMPISPDLYQLNDQLTVNETLLSNGLSAASFNPPRRILRERQNKYYNYDRIRPFWEASTEDFFTGKGPSENSKWYDNLKWMVGFRIQSFKIQSYWHDRDGGEAEQNSQTLIDIQKPTGYNATEKAQWANTIHGALAYDSRPRSREKNPDRGTFADIHLEGAGNGTGSAYTYTRLTLTFRQYHKILPSFFDSLNQELIFGYRILGQKTYGDAPFFELGTITTITPDEWNEGLDANKGIRGYNAGQFVDKNMAMLNGELRYTLLKSDVLGGIDVMLVGYGDTGTVAPAASEMKIKGFHSAFGGGVRLIWERNTVINISYGKSKYASNMNFSFNHPF